MAEEEQAQQEESPNSVQRASTSALAIGQIILAFSILVSVNYLSGTHHKAWDLSQRKEFTLSSQTRKLLASDLLRSRPEPVQMIAAVRKSSVHYVRLRAMLEEYKRLARGKIQIRLIDPIRDANEALEIADKYDIAFVEDLVIIDAVPKVPLDPANDNSAEERAKTLAELRSTHVQYVTVEDMLVFGTDPRPDAERRLLGYQDENHLTSGIRRAIEGKPRLFYLLADKSQVGGASEDAPWEFLSRTFAGLNIRLVPTQLSGLGKIPEDAAGIALVAPRYDLDERELAIFEEYWGRPRAAVLVVLDPTLREQPPRLRAFLRAHGVTPRANRIFTMRGDQQVYDVAATFTNAPAVGDLANASALFEGASSSLEIRENAGDLDLHNIETYPLIKALDHYQAQPRGGGPLTQPPLYLGASVSQGGERRDATARETSRMIVLSNSSFLEPRGRHKEHLDFVRNTSNWLIGREELMGIGPHPVQHYLLNLGAAEISFANKLNLFYIPGAFLLIALFVWNARRA